MNHGIMIAGGDRYLAAMLLEKLDGHGGHGDFVLVGAPMERTVSRDSVLCLSRGYADILTEPMAEPSVRVSNAHGPARRGKKGKLRRW